MSGRPFQEEEAAAEEEAEPVRTVADIQEGMKALQDMVDTGELSPTELDEVEGKLAALDTELEELLPTEIEAQEAKLAEEKEKTDAMEDGAAKTEAQEAVDALAEAVTGLKDLQTERGLTPIAACTGAEKCRDLCFFVKQGVLTDITVSAPDSVKS